MQVEEDSYNKVDRESKFKQDPNFLSAHQIAINLQLLWNNYQTWKCTLLVQTC